MLLLTAIAVTTAAAPAGDRGIPEVQASATVRIVHPTRITAYEWHRPSDAQRREIVVRDASGQSLLLRLVEMP